MSEENKILEPMGMDDTPADVQEPTPPKRRGRKKKSETAITENASTAVPEENITPEDEQTTVEGKTESEGADEPQIDFDNTDGNIADTDSDGNNEPQAKTENSEESSDITLIPEDTESEEAVEGAYASIEHFSDTYEIKYLSDDVESAFEVKKEESFPEVDEEYENLKIFDDTEPEIKREPKEKRVREVSPDYKEYNAEKPRHVDVRFDFIELFVYTLVVIMLLTTFFFKHSEVYGWSMKGSLSDKDHLIISDFLYEPKQYDIVVIHDPEKHEDAVVKRIIALGGQTVRLEYKLNKEKSDMPDIDVVQYDLEIYVDGEKVPDKYRYVDGVDYTINILNKNHKVNTDESKIDPETRRLEYAIFEYVVPEGEVYVLGDHRNDSTDSRRFGSVSENRILGKVILRIFPFDSFGTVD